MNDGISASTRANAILAADGMEKAKIACIDEGISPAEYFRACADALDAKERAGG